MMALTLQLVVVCCNANEWPCVNDVRGDHAPYYHIPYNTTERETSAAVSGDVFSKSSLFYVAQFVYFNETHLQPLYLKVCDDNHEANQDCANSTVPLATYVASRRVHHATLGPSAWNFLTLGSMDAAERINVSIIITPILPCPGKDDVYIKTFRAVRLSPSQKH